MTAEKSSLPLPDSLSAPARRALAAAGIENLGGVAMLTKTELKKLHGVGPMTILQLDRALRSNGLEFRA